MPKDDINYSFTENGIVYDFYDVFVPAENFRQPTLFVWGRGLSGELGNNAITSRSTPVTTFAGGTNWKQVAGGSTHTAAIKTDGSLWTWGVNGYGQLGINDTTTRSTPVTTFAGGTNWKQVAVGGGSHTSAIKTDGTLWTWGFNGYGQLGNFSNTNRSTPVTTFAGGTDWKQVAVGGSRTAAIKTDGTLWTWGLNSSSQLGVNDGAIRSTPVTTLTGGTNWKSVSCGSEHTAAIKTDGTLWIWGLGTSGQLGNNAATNRSTPVTTFSGGTNWKSVAGGLQHTAAIKTDGSLWVWGLGTSGQLGNDGTINRSTPVTTFAGGTDWKQVACGQQYTAAIKTDGTLWIWGLGTSGQLGNNAAGSRSTPVTTFVGGNNWKSVTAGGSHTIAIKYSPDP